MNTSLETINNKSTFDFEGLNIRVINKDNEAWFVLADVAKALGVGNARKMSKMVDEEDKSNQKLHSGSPATIINESGLFTVILRSNAEKARPFRRWVTTEVLPAIRKTGTYTNLPSLELVPVPQAQSLDVQSMIYLITQSQQQQSEQFLQMMQRQNEMFTQTMTACFQKVNTEVGEIDNRVTAIEVQQHQYKDALDTFEKPSVEAPPETYRMKLNKAVATISRLSGKDYQQVWNELYYDFRLRFHIDLKARARAKGVKPLAYADLEGYCENLYAIAFEKINRLQAVN